MLRTLTTARPPTFTHLKSASFTVTRRYSTPTPSPSTLKNQPNTLPTSPIKKPKIDLRPGPIKPKNTLPSSLPPIKSARPASFALNSTLKHGSAKEEVIRDISDAEKHGILTPPPADADWFKRTLHQAIQLIVRLLYVMVAMILISSLEILLPWREAHIQPSKRNCLN